MVKSLIRLWSKLSEYAYSTRLKEREDERLSEGMA